MGLKKTSSCQSVRIQTGAGQGGSWQSGDRGQGVDGGVNQGQRVIRADASQGACKMRGRADDQPPPRGDLSTGMPKEILGAQADAAEDVPAASCVAPGSSAPGAFLSAMPILNPGRK